MISALEQYAALRRVEFDCPFQVGHSGNIYPSVDGVYAPEVWHDEVSDVLIGEEGWEVSEEGWEAFSTGYTGQHGYSGPVMHASEYIGGRLADDILTTPGVYVVCAVEVLPEDDDPEPFPAGWIVLRKVDQS